MKYPIGIQNFKSLREEGYAYVDKTLRIYNLVWGGKYYFLSRPRRFGKSLLLSTLKAYFEGKRELFKGLVIEQLEKEWRQYPVLYLDLNAEKYTEKDSLISMLNLSLLKWESLYGKGEGETTLASRFKGVIFRAAKQSETQKVVILVDEYDKPLLQAIDNLSLQSDYRNILKAFYGNLKSCDEYIRFAMLTGVSKFSHVSISSDLNNLADISLDGRYADLCGITSDEIDRCFTEGIDNIAKHTENTAEEVKDHLRQMYDGYHFSKEMAVDIYNPFSLLNALSSGNIDNYWFSTGTPTFLVKLLRAGNYDLQSFSTAELTTRTLASKESIYDEPIALFYQTGYLTIKGYDKEFSSYRLGFPNREVEESFLHFLLPSYVGGSSDRSDSCLEHLVKDLRRGDIEGFMQRMQSFFAGTPYELIRDVENHYQNVMFTVCRLMGYYTVAEYHTSKGRIDMVVATQQYRYVFEFKFDGTAEQALAQIESREYALPFIQDEKEIVKVGVNFSSETRNIESWVVKR